MNLKIFIVLSLFITLQANGGFSEEIEKSIYDCNGVIYNDEMAEYCADQNPIKEDNLLWEIGARKVFHSFEKISKNLTPQIEQDYDLVLLVNTAEVASQSPHDFIPSQSMIVVEKPRGANRIFKRNSQGVIIGLAQGVRQLSQIIGSGHRNKISKSTSQNYGMPYLRDGLEVVPVSTGSAKHLLSFSGIFQMNWGRSKDLPRRSWNEPMSNPLYLGYYYTRPNGTRERISYAAAHGTPKANWKLLGKARDSHGCTRVHPAIMEDLRGYVEDLPFYQIFEFNWDYELPVQDSKIPYAPRKPMLFMIFNGYSSQSA